MEVAISVDGGHGFFGMIADFNINCDQLIEESKEYVDSIDFNSLTIVSWEDVEGLEIELDIDKLSVANQIKIINAVMEEV